jgi:hypothetical protein
VRENKEEETATDEEKKEREPEERVISFHTAILVDSITYQIEKRP